MHAYKKKRMQKLFQVKEMISHKYVWQVVYSALWNCLGKNNSEWELMEMDTIWDWVRLFSTIK